MKFRFSFLALVLSAFLLSGCGDSASSESKAMPADDGRPKTAAQDPDKVIDPYDADFDLGKFRFEDYTDPEQYTEVMEVLCKYSQSFGELDTALTEIAGAERRDRFGDNNVMSVLERRRNDAYQIAGFADLSYYVYEYRFDTYKRGIEVDTNGTKILFCNVHHTPGEEAVVVLNALDKLGQ